MWSRKVARDLSLQGNYALCFVVVQLQRSLRVVNQEAECAAHYIHVIEGHAGSSFVPTFVIACIHATKLSLSVSSGIIQP
jgi:hypothetical protein